MRSAPNQTCAFTLLELLVVLGVVLLLTALLFPARAKTASNVKSTGCLSNLKLWANAEQMYAADNFDSIPRDGMGANGVYPGSPFPSGSPLDPAAWFNLLPQYFGEQTLATYYTNQTINFRASMPFPGGKGPLWECPAASMTDSDYAALNGGGQLGFFSYEFNIDLKKGYSYPLMPKLSILPKPGATILMFDNAFNPITEAVSSSPQFNSVNPANRFKNVSIRHNTGAFLAFCDGHVQYFRTYYLTNGANFPAATEALLPDVIWDPVYRAANP